MRLLAVMAVLALIAGCVTSKEPLATRSERLGPLAFEIPNDWKRTDAVNGSARTSVWTPATNERKESISILRIERAANKVQGTPIDELVAAMQGSLRDAKTSGIERINTSRGLAGARVTVQFTPRMLSAPYQRVQATLLDGDALIHVFYTAAEPDHALEAFTAVLDSLRHEEG
jgi:hypothetical protein